MQVLTELALPLAIYLGGMLFWPAFRILSPKNKRRNHVLLVIAVIHLVMVGGVSLLTWVLLQQGVRDVIHLMSIAALLGGLSLSACVLTVIQTKKSTN